MVRKILKKGSGIAELIPEILELGVEVQGAEGVLHPLEALNFVMVGMGHLVHLILFFHEYQATTDGLPPRMACLSVGECFLKTSILQKLLFSREDCFRKFKLPQNN